MSPLPWLEFRSQAELARFVSLDLARLLKHPANPYGLTVNELERLEVYLRTLENKPVERVREANAAGGGGVLLDAHTQGRGAADVERRR